MRAVVAAALLMTGCFYLDPIVPRPRVYVAPQAPHDAAYRGGPFAMAARYMDPETHPGTYIWQVFACANIAMGVPSDCDDTEFVTATSEIAEISVPVHLIDRPEQLVRAITVTLEARDDRGALAQATTPFAVANGPPTLELGAQAHSYTVGAPIDLFVMYGDPDDPVASIELLSPEIVPPMTPLAYTLEDLPVPPPTGTTTANQITIGKRLTPREAGAWSVAFTARDPAGARSATQVFRFTAAPDRPPCLAQWQPIVPPDGETVPITAPTVFQVPLVDDDLDAYPRVSDAPQFGTATFVWSMLRPGASAREVLIGATGNRIDFDPGAFTPGDIVELRVEVFDRNRFALPCSDGEVTCSINGSSACLQRLTWRVEAR